MYILKNAWTNIKRNKGRNILIGIIIVVIACACTITLAIKNTASSLISSYENAYQVEASINLNRESMKEDFDFTKEEGMSEMQDAFSNIASLTATDIENYGDSDYVKSYYYTYSLGLNGSDIEAASSDFSFGKEKSTDSSTENSNTDQNKRGPEMSSTDFTLTGYSTIESMSEFIEGKYTVTSSSDDAWDKIFNGSYCMINSELAELNNIAVEDTISLVDPDDATKVYQFEVVGIFEESSDNSSTGDMSSMFASSANTIITNASVLSEIDTANDNLTGKITPTFILNSYDDVDAFQKELYSKGMSEYYAVSTNESEVTSATSSVANVSSFATTFLVITLIIGAIVLFVINQINVRERKYEIGVLRTIGMKKSLLTLQFVSELLIIALASLILGAGIGAGLSASVGNMLLANEIESSEESTNQVKNNFGGNMQMGTPPSDSSKSDSSDSTKSNGQFDMNKVSGIVSVQAYDSIDAVVDFTVIMELLLLGIGLTLVSSISSMISIQRFSPIEILKERG